MPNPQLVVREILDVAGVVWQLTSSLANIGIAALLYVDTGGSAYFAVHVGFLVCSALILAGLWAGPCRESAGAPSWVRKVPIAITFPLTLPIYFLVPVVCLVFERRRSTVREAYKPFLSRSTSRAMKEEELELRRAANLNTFLNGLVEISGDSHACIMFQLGFEGAPLLLTQLVVIVQGFLDQPSNLSSPAVSTALKALIYVSMTSVVLQLVSHAYMICRSFDIRVFCLRWLFCLYDLTTMLYMIVFLTTVGKPFASLKQLSEGDLLGGNGLSQAWLLCYLTVTVIVGVAIAVIFITEQSQSFRLTEVALLTLGIAGFVPAICVGLGVKLLLVSFVWQPLEPYTAYHGQGGIPIMFAFSFLRKKAWDERFQFICWYIHRILQRGNVQPKHHAAKLRLRKQWKELFHSSVWGPVGLDSGVVGTGHDAAAATTAEETPVPDRFVCKSQFQRHYTRPGWRHRLFQFALQLFLICQLFTFLFPYLAIATYRREQSYLLSSLLAVSVVELAAMVPLIPRFIQYCRFLNFGGASVAVFSTRVSNYFEYDAPLDGEGNKVSIMEAAIQAFYTPPHELVVTSAIEESFSTISSAREPKNTSMVRSVLLPFDVVAYLSTFSSAAQIDIRHLSQQEVEWYLEAARLQGGDREEAGPPWGDDHRAELGETTPLLR